MSNRQQLAHRFWDARMTFALLPTLSWKQDLDSALATSTLYPAISRDNPTAELGLGMCLDPEPVAFLSGV
jgi:hypothetical protein